MWNGVVGIIHEMKRCENAGAITAAVSMAYVCIDTMAFLSAPEGMTGQTKKEFIDWVNAYLEGHPDQPYQYDGLDLYAARCGVLHAFSAEAELHRKDQSIKKFGYHDGGRHIYQPDVSPSLVLIGVPSFLNDVVHAVEAFMAACQADSILRERVENRLSAVFQMYPVPT